MKNLLFILVTATIMSCAESKNQSEEKNVIVGYNPKLEVTSCYQDNSTSCTLVGYQFLDDCYAKGFQVRTCGDCTHLCSGNPYGN